MNSFAHKFDPREAQYARFAQAVLASLREAVQRRTDEGMTRKAIADRIDMPPTSLSRLLNGRVRNITIKTISDVFWATEFEPVEFTADALEDLSPNHCPAHLGPQGDTPAESAPTRMITVRARIGDSIAAPMIRKFELL